MGDALLSALLSVVVEKATDRVLHQFGAMWGIHDKLQKLERKLLSIQDKLGDAEERQVRDRAVKIWLAELKDAAYEADDILAEFNVEAMRRRAEIQIDMTKKVRSFFSLGNPVWFRFKMGRKLNDIVEKIEKLVDEGNEFGFMVRTPPQNGDTSQTHSYVVESEVIGRGRDRKEIVKLLLDHHDSKQNVAVLSIVGMGGLGKTTLAQLIYKDKQVVDHFELRIWVCVSREFDVKELAKQIIASASRSKPKKGTMVELQQILREVVSGKRYLLVLDDVWNEDQEKWDELKTLLETGGEGSRIIVTTRSKRVSRIMGTLNTCNLQYLTEDDSSKLFRKRAFKEGAEEPQNLVSIGREIVRKCGGLPLAVNTLGSLMRDKSEEREWKSVRDSEIWHIDQVGEDGILPALRLSSEREWQFVRDSEIWHIDQVGEDGILPALRLSSALRLSYTHLPSHLKQCFAFCAVFPKDYEMEKDLLIQLWMANGFIPSDGRRESEDKGHEIFNVLAWRSFFQDIKEAEDCGAREYRDELPYNTTCKMSDVMYDLARSILGNECLGRPDREMREHVSWQTRHLCISEDDTLNNYRTLNNSYPNIRTLLFWRKGLFNKITVAADSSKPKFLRALDLRKTSIKRLPIAIRYLKHLRYLDLSGSDIEVLPNATSTLFNLQTLKLSNCRRLSKLPDDMRNMSSLRHLYVHGGTFLEHMPADMGQMRSLRTLTRYIVGNDAARGIGQLNGLNLGGLLELCNLRNVRDAAEARQADMCSKQSLRSLMLCWDMKRWDPNIEPAQNAKEVLEALRPHDGLKMLTVWRYGGGSFPTWMTDSQLLQNLVEIHLKVCPGCQHLPPLWQLPSLEFLYIVRMHSVKHICSSTIYDNASNGRVQAFPKLKKMVLQMMQSLSEWSECEEAKEVTLVFPLLAELEIIDCPDLMTMPELPSLKSLKLGGTNKLLDLARRPTTPSSLDIPIHKTSNVTESPPLAQTNLFITRAMSFRYLTSLLTLRIECCDDLVHWPEEGFCSLNLLKEIRIHGCNKLVGPSPLPSSSSSSGDGELLPNLEKLYISCCDGLLELPKLPASLRSLSIHRCDKLNSLMKGLQHATALANIRISVCQSLTSLPADLGHLTALKSMYISQLPRLTCLPQGSGQLTALKDLVINDCRNLSYLPDGLQGLTALRDLSLGGCARLSLLPEGLQQRLPSLHYLVIKGCPNLERQYKTGGPYWHLISRIPHTIISSEFLL